VSHLEPSRWEEITGKWVAALVCAYLSALGFLGVGFRLVFTHPVRLSNYVEGTDAVYLSLCYVGVGGLFLCYAHRMEDAD
jgi:hypothetical protein